MINRLNNLIHLLADFISHILLSLIIKISQIVILLIYMTDLHVRFYRSFYITGLFHHDPMNKITTLYLNLIIGFYTIINIICSKNMPNQLIYIQNLIALNAHHEYLN